MIMASRSIYHADCYRQLHRGARKASRCARWNTEIHLNINAFPNLTVIAVSETCADGTVWQLPELSKVGSTAEARENNSISPVDVNFVRRREETGKLVKIDFPFPVKSSSKINMWSNGHNNGLVAHISCCGGWHKFHRFNRRKKKFKEEMKINRMVEINHSLRFLFGFSYARGSECELYNNATATRGNVSSEWIPRYEEENKHTRFIELGKHPQMTSLTHVPTHSIRQKFSSRLRLLFRYLLCSHIANVRMEGGWNIRQFSSIN